MQTGLTATEHKGAEVLSRPKHVELRRQMVTRLMEEIRELAGDQLRTCVHCGENNFLRTEWALWHEATPTGVCLGCFVKSGYLAVLGQ